jgi:hypothetical protein
MRVEDYSADCKRWRPPLNEEGGKVHEMPAHHNLEAYLDAYMYAGGLFIDGHADAGETEGHQRDQRPVAQADDGRRIDAVEQLADLRG